MVQNREGPSQAEDNVKNRQSSHADSKDRIIKYPQALYLIYPVEALVFAGDWLRYTPSYSIFIRDGDRSS